METQQSGSGRLENITSFASDPLTRDEVLTLAKANTKRSKEAYRHASRLNQRVAGCGESALGSVALSPAPGGAQLLGLMYCGNLWLCENCTRIKQAQRTERLALVAEYAERHGLVVAMITLTAAHSVNGSNPVSQDMRVLWKKLTIGWRAATSGRQWAADSQSIRGMARATEPTLDDYTVKRKRTGAHIHFHVLAVAEPHDGLTHYEQMQTLARSMWGRWSKRLAREGISTNIRGLHVRVAGHDGLTAADVAGYVGKGDKGASRLPAAEIASSATKNGSYGRLTPFQLLRSLHPDNKLTDNQRRAHMAQWFQYEIASYGQRALTVSDGFAELEALAIAELVDSDDVVMGEAASQPVPEVLVLPYGVHRLLTGEIATLTAMVAPDRQLDVLEAFLGAEGHEALRTTADRYWSRVGDERRDLAEAARIRKEEAEAREQEFQRRMKELPARRGLASPPPTSSRRSAIAVGTGAPPSPGNGFPDDDF